MTTGPDREAPANRLAGVALAAGYPTGWLGQLYAQARAGAAVVPRSGIGHNAC